MHFLKVELELETPVIDKLGITFSIELFQNMHQSSPYFGEYVKQSILPGGKTHTYNIQENRNVYKTVQHVELVTI